MKFGDDGMDMNAALFGKPTKPCGCPIPYGQYESVRQAYMQQLSAFRTMNDLAAANAIGDIAGMATAFIKASPRELTQDEVYERDARRELEDYLGDLPEVVLFDVRFAE